MEQGRRIQWTCSSHANKTQLSRLVIDLPLVTSHLNTRQNKKRRLLKQLQRKERFQQLK